MHLVESSVQSAPVLLTQALGLGAIVWAGFQLKKSDFAKDHLTLSLGLIALVLAGQAVNISLASSFSGHFLGATLLTLLLGPAAALVSMASILTVQAIAFGDGSFATLGANFLVLGVAPVVVSQCILKLRSDANSSFQNALYIGGAAFLSVVGGALLLSVILGSHHLELLINHSRIALLESGLTLAAVGIVSSARKTEAPAIIQFARAAFVAALFAAAIPFSSNLPDGLEVVIEDQEEIG